MRRRRFSRRGAGRRRFHRRKPRFARRVMRAEIINQPTKRLIQTNTAAVSLHPGDGTTPELVIFSPLTNIVQGDTVGNFTGNVIFPKGIRIRALVTNAASPGFQQFYIRWTLFWSKARASYPVNGQLFGSTTTANTNPAQTSPNANPPIYDSAQPFVSIGFQDPYDVTKIKVIAKKTWNINKIGAGPGTSIFDTFLRFPKRRIVYEDTLESPLTSAPNYPLYGNYYLYYQVYSAAGTGTISSTQIGTMDVSMTMYFKCLG